MTTVEALTSIAQIALRARGQWHNDGLEQTLRGDIRAMVVDCAKLIRINPDENEPLIIGEAIIELERRANLAAA